MYTYKNKEHIIRVLFLKVWGEVEKGSGFLDDWCVLVFSGHTNI